MKAKKPIEWMNVLNSVLIARSKDVAKNKIAAFDLDGTLIATKSGRVFPKDEYDWRWWDPCIPKCLEKLHSEGYKLVIISNQNGLNSEKKIKSFKTKIEAILNQIEPPILLLAAMEKDRYRKPMTGMWDWLMKNNSNLEVNKSQCFYVGDAAGRGDGWKLKRKKDHSCSDRKFADNVQIKFYTPEEYFLKEAPAKFTWGGFNAKEHLALALPQYSAEDTPLVPVDARQELVVCVGYPASGKSSFVKRYLVPKGYIYVNQDSLKSREKCVTACQVAISGKKSVVVDNTNPDRATRAVYIKLAQNAGVPVRCFYFGDNEDLALHNNFYRAIHRPDEKRDVLSTIAFRTFKSKLQEPTTMEGFSEVKKINFVFEGTEQDKEAWQKWWH
ncbi:polynucleotide kinase 3 phosphatase-domain-containing protein [Mycotypha africana]|uniref:polynucleotide kinase 3 phosphatase-domain-containing protein n=1 Tax=Mycotypha africana TaxID=64632 RepID=UPI0022FFCFF3|nr:polynucleotide kinase 3 phosphatase-domain-containing protein [Mycotypha africana]KAI8987800.1 polynucleotide kinase 3 phosphatase-domain-containing protein [Mycotypha africana]